MDLALVIKELKEENCTLASRNSKFLTPREVADTNGVQENVLQIGSCLFKQYLNPGSVDKYSKLSCRWIHLRAGERWQLQRTRRLHNQRIPRLGDHSQGPPARRTWRSRTQAARWFYQHKHTTNRGLFCPWLAYYLQKRNNMINSVNKGQHTGSSPDCRKKWLERSRSTTFGASRLYCVSWPRRQNPAHHCNREALPRHWLILSRKKSDNFELEWRCKWTR